MTTKKKRGEKKSVQNGLCKQEGEPTDTGEGHGRTGYKDEVRGRLRGEFRGTFGGEVTLTYQKVRGKRKKNH